MIFVAVTSKFMTGVLVLLSKIYTSLDVAQFTLCVCIYLVIFSKTMSQTKVDLK